MSSGCFLHHRNTLLHKMQTPIRVCWQRILHLHSSDLVVCQRQNWKKKFLLRITNMFKLHINRNMSEIITLQWKTCCWLQLLYEVVLHTISRFQNRLSCGGKYTWATFCARIHPTFLINTFDTILHQCLTNCIWISVLVSWNITKKPVEPSCL